MSNFDRLAPVDHAESGLKAFSTRLIDQDTS